MSTIKLSASEVTTLVLAQTKALLNQNRAIITNFADLVPGADKDYRLLYLDQYKTSEDFCKAIRGFVEARILAGDDTFSVEEKAKLLFDFNSRPMQDFNYKYILMDCCHAHFTKCDKVIFHIDELPCGGLEFNRAGEKHLMDLIENSLFHGMIALI